MIRARLLSILLLASLIDARPLDRVRKDAFTVGIRSGLTPFGLGTGSDRGFDYELTAALSEGMGVPFRIVPLESLAQGEALLASDRIDAIVSCVKAGSTKADRFVESRPYHRSGLGVLALKSDSQLYTILDLGGKRIATVPEAGADLLIESSIPKSKVEMVTTTDQAISLLQRGEADAVVDDLPRLQYLKAHTSGLRLLDVTLREQSYVVVLDRKSASLVTAVNSELERLRTAPSPETPSPLAALCGRYGVTSTIRPILRPGSPATASPAPQPALSRPPASATSTAAHSAQSPQAAVDALLKRVQQLEDELVELKRTLNQTP